MVMAPTPMLVALAGQDHDTNVLNDPGFSSFLNFCSILSGSGPQMVMAPTMMSAGQDHDPNVPKGARVVIVWYDKLSS